jgi:hypothetical protein
MPTHVVFFSGRPHNTGERLAPGQCHKEGHAQRFAFPLHVQP